MSMYLYLNALPLHIESWKNIIQTSIRSQLDLTRKIVLQKKTCSSDPLHNKHFVSKIPWYWINLKRRNMTFVMIIRLSIYVLPTVYTEYRSKCLNTKLKDDHQSFNTFFYCRRFTRCHVNGAAQCIGILHCLIIKWRKQKLLVCITVKSIAVINHSHSQNYWYFQCREYRLAFLWDLHRYYLPK